MIHGRLTWIHPFEDGNGKSARVIMNWLLTKNGFPMFFIPLEKREEYYFILEETEKGNNKNYVSRRLRLIIDQVRIYGYKKKK